MEMFDGVVETKISGDRKVTVKRYITDEETLAEMEMRKACEALVEAEQKFNKIAARKMDANFDVCAWWDALEERYQWRLACSPDVLPPSPSGIRFRRQE